MNNNIINTKCVDTFIPINNTEETFVTQKINTKKTSASFIDYQNTKVFDAVSQILFSAEEYKIIMLLKNNNGVSKLTFKQLVALSKLYTFSNEDLISLQNNFEFIKYLDNSKTLLFSNFPEALKQNLNIAKIAFFLGYYTYIKYIPKHHQTEETYSKFVVYCLNSPNCYTHIRYISEKLLTKEILNRAFIYHSFYFCKELFSIMPDNLKTQDFCASVFYRSVDCFDFLPDKFKTLSICAHYISNASIVNLGLIPKRFRNELQDIFVARIKNFNTDLEYKRPYEILGLECLPEEILDNNPDIIIKACISSSIALLKLNPIYINSHILKEIAKVSIENIPKKYMSIDLVLTWLKGCSFLNTKESCIVDRYFMEYKDEIQQVALQRIINDGNMNLLCYIPDYLTEEKCYQYINNFAYNYDRLPDIYKFNINVILYMLKTNNNNNNIHTLECNLLSTEEYQKIFDNYPKTPLWQLSISNHNRYIEHKINLLNSIPADRRSLDIWLYLCNNSDRKYINKIPKQMFTKEALHYLVDEYVKWDNIMDIDFIEKTFYHEYFDDTIEEKILLHSLRCVARSSDVFFSIIKSTKITQNFKNKLLNNIKIGCLGFPSAKAAELYSKTNPIEQAVDTKFATGLLSSCYKYNQESQLELPKITRYLREYITRKEIYQLPLDDNKTITFDNAKITGGRTVQVGTSKERLLFYKFRKPKEDLTSFIKEGYFFKFLNQDTYGNTVKQKLKSSIPVLEKVVRIPVENLPKQFFSCEDGIDKFTDSQGERCVDALVFWAPSDYLKYAHKIDVSNELNPYEKPEKGILNACHDIGVFTSMGVYHTSTLPAYHYAVENRKWSALHMLLRNIDRNFCRGEIGYPTGNDIKMVGKLEKWDTSATSRPDYGYTGLRDFGDCEFLGEIQGILQHKDSKNVKNFPTVIQNILAANTICECLLAAVLLYARLHKSSADYHYKNNYHKQKMIKFIENIFSEFLLGRLQILDINLADFMNISVTDYNKWLDRAATEILYWTATKHNLATHASDIDFNDHVSEHIKNRKLPTDLYDHYHMLDNPSFNIVYNKDNLGCDNATFPLIAIMNFIFLFNTRLKDHTST